MRLPDFLIIGAMKSGTSTLFRDLQANRQVCLPLDKEPNNLADEHVLTSQGRKEYAALFSHARSGQVCGEASTAYTKLPQIDGVPQRARELLGGDVRLIYLVRDPVARAISHHYHEVCRSAMPATLDEALPRHPELISYSQYAMQLKAWLEYFDPEQIKLVVFEQYIQNREAILEECKDHFGIRSSADGIDEERAFNKTGDARVMPEGWRKKMQQHFLYQKVFRRLLSPTVRDLLRAKLLPKPPTRPPKPSRSTIERIAEAVFDDVEQLRDMFPGTVIPWDLQSRIGQMATQSELSVAGSGGLPNGLPIAEQANPEAVASTQK